MYQSLLANALDQPDLTFEATTTPFPVFYAFKLREQAAQSFDFAFMITNRLVLSPCIMIFYILYDLNASSA